jgi:vacuolar-type H+-ATPase subunit D/Vma8
VTSCTLVIVRQARIAQKEEALSRYEQLLHQARDEMAAASRRHEEEIRVMQKQLHEKNELAFKKYKMAVKESVNQPNKPIASNEQVIVAPVLLQYFG